jgi:hypothetical protein
MGVPVISLAGRMSAGRQGVRFLRGVGMDELLAESLEDYVRIASDLASDIVRLAELRSGLRERMSRSPLMDAPRLTCGLEAAYRALWEQWLAARDREETAHRNRVNCEEAERPNARRVSGSMAGGRGDVFDLTIT